MGWPDWSGATAVVVATGPSASGVPLETGKDRAKFIAIKDGWKLCPWADYLYACDHHWWQTYNAVLDFKGRRIAYDTRTIDKWRGVKFLKVEIKKTNEDLLFDKPGVIAWGGNSGFHGLNLACQFGAAKIILVGFDMRVDQGKHFFGPHPYTDERPSVSNCEKWRKILDRQANTLSERGTRVINCSPVSALTAYPKMSFEDALNA